jgi:hypothetical protein
MEDIGVLRLRVLVSVMRMANALTSLIFVSAVLLTVNFAIAGLYPLAAGLGLSLLAYGYLVRWGGRPIEDRFLSPPRSP